MSATLLAIVGLLSIGQSDASPKAKDQPASLSPDPSWKPLGPSLWFDPKGKRLVIEAKVAFRDGPLEHLLCLQGTKEHESILATAAAAKRIHAGLLLTGAESGKPVRFEPKFSPPTGATIAIELQWIEKGQKRSADARSWVTDLKTKKPLTTDWVFAGSEIFTDPETKEKIYAADDGDLVTVANFASAILDLPFRSNASDADRMYVANTPDIPERMTPVLMFLSPKPKPKAVAPKSE